MDKSKFSTHISVKDIKVTDSFWGSIMERIRTQVIPYQWEALNDRVPGSEKVQQFHALGKKLHEVPVLPGG